MSRTPIMAKVLGTTGVRHYGGELYSNERDPRLSGVNKYLLFSEMMANTAIVGAGIRYFLNLLAKARWRVEASDPSDPVSVERAAWFKTQLTNLETPWPRVVKRAAMYKFYGFSIQEWTVGKDEATGYLTLRDVSPRPQATIYKWDIDSHGKVRGVIQRDPLTFTDIPLPRHKLLYVVDDALDTQPDGLGLLRHVVKAANRLQRLEDLEAMGYETDLRGIPLIQAPLALLNELVEKKVITEEAASALLTPLEQFASNHIRAHNTGLLYDSSPYTSADEAATPVANTPQWAISLLRGGNQGLIEVSTAIKRINFEIARTLGVEALMLGSDGRGSFALSRDKTITFTLVVDGTLSEIAESVHDDIATPLWRMNGWDLSTLPVFRTDVIQFRDIESVANTLYRLAQAGVPVSRLDEAVGEMYDQLGLTRLDPDLAPLSGADNTVDTLPPANSNRDSGDEE